MTNLKELDILLQFSKIINSNNDINKICLELKKILPELRDINLYFYDYSLKKLKDIINNFSLVEDIFDKNETRKLYERFIRLSECNFIIDNKNITEIRKFINFHSIFIPVHVDNNIIGMVEIYFEKKTDCTDSLLKTLIIISNQLFLSAKNIMLQNRLQVNSDFYAALKNIAKIIETQYELNYIIPLIGEMIDKFVSNHLIYIFVKQGNDYNLCWPNACRDKRIYELIKRMKEEFILSEDKKIGVFPLKNSQNVIGCIAAYSTIDTLTSEDIGYIHQLTKQSSVTIDRANSYAETLKHATLDALTGLNNRRQFECRLKEVYASAKRQKQPLCAIMLDIDFFKKINDTYGHATGDKVLKLVAGVIKSQLREYDIPSRYGGEEFCILLPQTKIEEATIVAERLRAAVEKNIIETFVNSSKNKEISVTISIGLSRLKDTDTMEDLYKRADKALYKAKEQGRNRVIVYE